LRYDDDCRAAVPDQAIQGFLQGTYEVTAILSGRVHQVLERTSPKGARR
jgi:hypothetical protein